MEQAYNVNMLITKGGDTDIYMLRGGINIIAEGGFEI